MLHDEHIAFSTKRVTQQHTMMLWFCSLLAGNRIPFLITLKWKIFRLTRVEWDTSFNLDQWWWKEHVWSFWIHALRCRRRSHEQTKFADYKNERPFTVWAQSTIVLFGMGGNSNFSLFMQWKQWKREMCVVHTRLSKRIPRWKRNNVTKE
jgi:hypothetical protein